MTEKDIVSEEMPAVELQGPVRRGYGKKITLTLKIGLMALGVAIFLVYLSTYVTWVPLLSSVSNYATVAFARISLPCMLAVFAAALGIAIWRRRELYFKLVIFLYVASLVMALGIVWGVHTTLGQAGADISLLKTYSISEPQGIIAGEYPYDTDEDGDVSLTVFGNSKSLLDDLGLEVKVSQAGKRYLAASDPNMTQAELEARVSELLAKPGIPIVVYIHGGGWIENDRYFRARQCKIFADEGFLSFTVDYTLSNENRHLAAGCATERQLARALAWINENAPLVGGDTSRIYLMGDSAGGNLALELAYKINGGVYTEADGSPLPRIAGVAAIYPVASPRTFYENDDPVFSDTAKQMAGSYAGGSPDEVPEVYEQIEPGNFITPDAPPTLIMVGEHDTLVPPQATYELADALGEAGVECKLVRVPFENHTMDVPTDNAACQAWAQLSRSWFESHS